MATKVSSFAERALSGRTSYSDSRFAGVTKVLFPETHRLLPQINQIYELDLAWGEFNRLADPEIVSRGAYFWSVNGTETNHYRICMRTPEQVNATARRDRKNFFAANVFAVGYATHGLFPYRGKFHPQMVKAILNIMGLRPGMTVLDPMAGCGTTGIEASIMGIDSLLVELSPFACLMSRAKVQALNCASDSFPALRLHALELFDQLQEEFGPHSNRSPKLFSPAEEHRLSFADKSSFSVQKDAAKELHDLLKLCFLDSVGYAERRANKTARELFPDVLGRYLDAVGAFNEVRNELALSLGNCRVIEGDARELQMSDNSADGVLFSPPYSFAIDYLENDLPQLDLLGVDADRLRQSMVGLRGEGHNHEARVEARLREYFADMRLIFRECSRVLRPGGYCTVVVGSNTNQTGGVTLEDRLAELARQGGLPLEFQIMREIEGIRNTMREEYLLFLRKPARSRSRRQDLFFRTATSGTSSSLPRVFSV